MTVSEVLVSLEREGLVVSALCCGFQPTYYLTNLGESCAHDLEQPTDDGGILSVDDECALNEFLRSLESWKEHG